ncbi:hypothetical protein ACFWAP_13670 [Streptomyces goshikiensis]|uniref:hypothetical protein n=1 Tax=Streptomyces goshikiensis TaxID=1942 RepID=UPI003660DCCB
MARTIAYALTVRLERGEGKPNPVTEVLQTLTGELGGFELCIEMESGQSLYRLTVDNVTTAIDLSRNV